MSSTIALLPHRRSRTTYVNVSISSSSEIANVPSKDGSVNESEPVPAELLPEEPWANGKNEPNYNAQRAVKIISDAKEENARESYTTK